MLIATMIFSNTSLVLADTKKFTDVTSSYWAYKEIMEFAENGYINGSDGAFRPDDSITRAEFVKIVNKSFGYTQKGKENFEDVNPGAWYYDEICIAVNAGYIDKYQSKFRPNDSITREEVAAIVTSIQKCKDDDLDKIKTYTDYDKVSSWALSSVEGAIERGYMGLGSKEFRPKSNITRAESVVTLSRIINAESIKLMYVTNTDTLNVRSGPSTSYEKIGTLLNGAEVEVVSTENNWAKIKYNGGYAYVSMNYLTTIPPSTGQAPLPTPTSTPSYVDAPQNTKVIDKSQDVYQSKLSITKTVDTSLKSLAISSVNSEFNINYQIYSSGKWISASNGQVLSNSQKTIEGIKIKLENAPSDYNIFYRTKVKDKGWQAWVCNDTISGEISNTSIVEDVEIRLIVAKDITSMITPKIAVDIGHNVPRPTLYGAVNGMYDEDYLTKIIGEKVIYKLRSMGYNVVDTLPKGEYTQSDELKVRSQIANLNQADKFVSIHFNSATETANGTEVYYSTTKSGSANMATKVVNNIANTFDLRNRGIKDGDHLYVVKNTQMPSILVEGMFITNQSDMDKFISKGSSAYDMMAQNIVEGIIN